MDRILCAQIKRGDNISHVFVESPTATHILLRISLLDRIVFVWSLVCGSNLSNQLWSCFHGPSKQGYEHVKMQSPAFEQSDSWNRQRAEGR